MKSGKLDRRVTIKSRVETQNSFGEAVISYTNLATVWAEVNPLSGREVFSAAQTYPQDSLKVKIRHRTDVDEKCQIIIDSVEYNIAYIAEIGRKEGLEMIVSKPT